MARRLSHQMSCSLSLGLAGQWTGVDIIRSETKPLSRLKLSKFHRDLNPHLNVIFRPGHGILSRYWNSHFSGTMVRHPHHDNIKWVGLGQWILILYYLSRTVHYPHPVQSLSSSSFMRMGFNALWAPIIVPPFCLPTGWKRFEMSETPFPLDRMFQNCHILHLAAPTQCRLLTLELWLLLVRKMG